MRTIQRMAHVEVRGAAWGTLPLTGPLVLIARRRYAGSELWSRPPGPKPPSARKAAAAAPPARRAA
jgi:hypothetical protein